MKKLLFLFAVSAMLLSASCQSNGNKSAYGESAPDSVIIAAADTLPAESPKATFISSDLKELGLLGNVRSVTQDMKDSYMNGLVTDNLAFDENGKRTAPTHYEYLDVILDEDGFITATDTDLGATDGSSLNTKFTSLNETGWPLKGTQTLTGPEEADYNLVFSYPETDDHGNWTVCSIKITGTYNDSQTISQINETVRILRKIEYYK